MLFIVDISLFMAEEMFEMPLVSELRGFPLELTEVARAIRGWNHFTHFLIPLGLSDR